MYLFKNQYKNQVWLSNNNNNNTTTTSTATTTTTTTTTTTKTIHMSHKIQYDNSEQLIRIK